jgi:hypothetical protein
MQSSVDRLIRTWLGLERLVVKTFGLWLQGWGLNGKIE